MVVLFGRSIMNEIIKPKMVFTKDLNPHNDKADVVIATFDIGTVEHTAIDAFNQRNFKPCRHVRKNGEFMGVFCNIDSIWIDVPNNQQTANLMARIEPYHFMPDGYAKLLNSHSMITFNCDVLSAAGVVKTIVNIEVVTP